MPNPSKLTLDMLSLKQREHAVRYLWDKQLNKLKDIDRVDEFVREHGQYSTKPKINKG